MLRHRLTARGRVVSVGAPPLDLEVAERLQIGDLPPPSDQGERPRDLSRVDVALEMLADSRQARRRETDVFRLGDHWLLLRSSTLPRRRRMATGRARESRPWSNR